MRQDLALSHQPLTDLFCHPSSPEQWSEFHLTDEQIKHFNDQGFVSGIKLLNDEQVKTLREELAEMVNPNHEGHELFYEYHSNESGDPESVLFHALGAWRVQKAFQDLLWNTAFPWSNNNIST
mgnify:FL=1